MPALAGIAPIGGGMWQHKRMEPMTDNPLALDPRTLRRHLLRAAPRFDAAAVLHREVGRRLIERLDFVHLQPQTIVDLGCGGGLMSADLRKRYPKTRYFALDSVEPLVRQARGRGGRWRRLPGVCAGLGALPFANDSVDLIFSNLALHRVDDLSATARELQRVLKPGGLLMFSTYGPDTLQELRLAWQSVDTTPHVHGFVDMHDIGDALASARLADPVMDVEHFTLTYEAVEGLIDDLTDLGLRNALKGRRDGLFTPRQWAAMCAAYEQYRDAEGRLPATWEIAYGHAWGTESQPQQSERGGEVRLPLETLVIPRRTS